MWKNVKEITVMAKLQILHKNITTFRSMQSKWWKCCLKISVCSHHLLLLLVKQILIFICRMRDSSWNLPMLLTRSTISAGGHIIKYICLIWSKKWWQFTRNWKQLILVCHRLVENQCCARRLHIEALKCWKEVQEAVSKQVLLSEQTFSTSGLERNIKYYLENQNDTLDS